MPGLDGGAVVHGFFGRRGGVSTGIYSGLNCGIGSADSPDNVRANRDAAARALGVGEENFLSLYQVHGKTCLKVTEPWSLNQRPEADAFVTDRPGIALGILTADCAPVLFRAETGGRPVIGAAHAGWGGALGGVLESTIEAMEELGAARGDIRAAIGPCIGQRSYEVGPEFYQRFIDEDTASDRFFKTSRRQEHFLFDLAGYCAARLARAAIGAAGISDRDTYALPGEFFSFRRSTHAGESDYGRQVSAIVIK